MSDGWQIVEALGSVTGGAVLVGGALLAARYGRKANPSVEASAYNRPDGTIILATRATVSVPGVLRIRMATEGDHAPIVRVVEVLMGKDGRLKRGEIRVGEQPLFGGERVSGGEVVSGTEEFPLPVPTLNLVGWRVSFLVDVRRVLWFVHFKSKVHWWRWAAGCFVPVPDKPEVKPT